MVYFLISDNADILTGFRMAGIDGVAVQTEEEARAAVDRAAADPNTGVLIVTQGAAALCAAKLAPLKSDRRTPLVVEIPGRGGASGSSDSIIRYIREAIGMKL